MTFIGYGCKLYLDYICNQGGFNLHIANEQLTISDAEWEVMRVLWAKYSITSREIINTLLDITEWKEGTIKSLINRLAQKGAIEKDQSTKPYTYHPSISLEEATFQRTDELIDQTCTRDRVGIIQHLIKENSLSQTDIQTLIEELQTKAQTAPEVVDCECAVGQCHCHLHQ